MKILWLNSGFLHPTTRGGQIRTLQMLRRLRMRHEIHYLAVRHARRGNGFRGASAIVAAFATCESGRHGWWDARSPSLTTRSSLVQNHSAKLIERNDASNYVSPIT